jgi:hypothetical protein
MPPRNRGRRPWSEEDITQLQAMYARNVSTEQIANCLGRSEKAIDAKLNNLVTKLETPGDPAKKRTQRRRSGASFFLS